MVMLDRANNRLEKMLGGIPPKKLINPSNSDPVSVEFNKYKLINPRGTRLMDMVSI